MQEKDDEERALLGAAEIDRTPVFEHLERTQNSKLHKPVGGRP